jgi:hypothetical protein
VNTSAADAPATARRAGRRILRAALLVQLLWALSALLAAGAAAQPGSGPRETVDQRFTTTRPNSPTGVSFTASYHAAGDTKAPPPYMRRMVFYPPRGMRYDTSVPKRCSASTVELQVIGPAACPAGSQLGGGTVEGLFQVPLAHDFVLDRYKHTDEVFNNANQQIVLIKSEGFTVVRGRFRPDGSLAWRPPTCFPTPPVGQCVDDYILQSNTATVLPPYTRTSGGRVRSYATTPPTCPARGYWRTRVRFTWANGAVDSVVTKQPCRRPA